MSRVYDFIWHLWHSTFHLWHQLYLLLLIICFTTTDSLGLLFLICFIIFEVNFWISAVVKTIHSAFLRLQNTTAFHVKCSLSLSRKDTQCFSHIVCFLVFSDFHTWKCSCTRKLIQSKRARHYACARSARKLFLFFAVVMGFSTTCRRPKLYVNFNCFLQPIGVISEN